MKDLSFNLSLSVSANSNGASWGEVPLYTGEIKLDGEKDAVYDDALKVQINHRTDGISGGATAVVSLLWSETKFYAFFEVTDKDIVKYDSARPVWENEGVEFTLDMKNDGSNRYKVTVCFEPNLVTPSGEAPENFAQAACKTTASGYNVEIVADLTTQNLQTPKAGVQYGINLLIDDMTGTNTRGIIRSVHKNNPDENDATKFDYIVLGSEEVGIEEIPEDIAPVEVADKTADPMPALVVFAVSASMSLAFAASGKNRKH